MQLFRSEEHARRLGQCGDPELVPVRQAFELGRVWYAARLRSDWQPWTAATAAAMFHEVGLTSPFWRS